MHNVTFLLRFLFSVSVDKIGIHSIKPVKTLKRLRKIGRDAFVL